MYSDQGEDNSSSYSREAAVPNISPNLAKKDRNQPPRGDNKR